MNLWGWRGKQHSLCSSTLGPGWGPRFRIGASSVAFWGVRPGPWLPRCSPECALSFRIGNTLVSGKSWRGDLPPADEWVGAEFKMTTGLTIPDPEALEDIFDFEDPEDCQMLKELYEHFLEEGITQVRRLSARMELGQLQEVDEIAHSLKSSFGNVGLGASSEICNGIMVNARAGHASAAREGVLELSSILDDMETGIRNFMRGL